MFTPKVGTADRNGAGAKNRKEEGKGDPHNASTGNGTSSDVATMSRTSSWLLTKEEKAQRNRSRFEKTLESHRDNVNFLYKLIQDGQHETTNTDWGRVWSNSCRWVVARKASLHALTPTHDRYDRATALGGSGGAYFGIDHGVPSVSSYNYEQLTDKTNIELIEDERVGFQYPGKIAVVFQGLSLETQECRRTIIHEVQHNADHHSDDWFGRYESEFNAYYVDKRFSRYSTTPGTYSATVNDGTWVSGFDNPRQIEIFLFLYNHPQYRYVSIEFGRSRSFKERVLKLKAPRAINLQNAPEVDDLYLILSKRPFNGSEAEAKLNAVSPGDRAAIAEPGMRDAWSALIAELPDRERTYFAEQLKVPIASTKSTSSLSVVDSLKQKAADAAEWIMKK